MLNVCVSSTDVDLTTTGALRAAIFGATATTTQADAELSRLIRQASVWAESHLGYTPTFQAYRETLPAYGSMTLMVARTPVRSVINLFDDPNSTSPLGTTTYRLENKEAGFLERDLGFDWTLAPQWELGMKLLPGQEAKQWAVEYTAGWSLVGTSSTWDGVLSTSRTLPEDIERAVIIKASEQYWRNLGNPVRRRTGDLEIDYGPTGRGGSSADCGAEGFLEPYVRIGATA